MQVIYLLSINKHEMFLFVKILKCFKIANLKSFFRKIALKLRTAKVFWLNRKTFFRKHFLRLKYLF